MAMETEVDQVIRAGGGVVRIRDHPRLARALQRLARRGVLVALLPGVYCHRDDADRPEIRINAAATWAPEAVMTGPAAARLSFWPSIEVPVVSLARPNCKITRPGFRIVQERLPAALTEHRGCWITVPALTALDLVPWVGGAGIDLVLRKGWASLDQLQSALAATAHRAGNGLRRAALLDSRGSPWSEAERLLHRILRRAGIRGWSGNAVVSCAGQDYPVDVVFRSARLIIEVDGYAYHRAENREQFHRDRLKWTTLTSHGWTVLHFTWEHLVDRTDWVAATIRKALSRSTCRQTT